MKKSVKLIGGISLTILVSVLTIVSCQKTVVEDQTFNDVFDTSQIQALNSVLEKSTTLSDLPVEFSQLELTTLPEAIYDVQLADVISYMEQKNQLSDEEVNLLLHNDINTYSAVVARLGALPTQLEEMDLNLPELQSGILSNYQLIQIQPLNAYYTTDYYSASIELQNYIKTNVILPLKNLNKLNDNTLALKSATISQSNTKKVVVTIVAVIIKEIKAVVKEIKKDLKDKKDKKHNGSNDHNGDGNGNNGNGNNGNDNNGSGNGNNGKNGK